MARRIKPPTYAEVLDWLIEHYSDLRRMPVDRIEILGSLRDQHPFLVPPPVKHIYRGLFNVTDATVQSIRTGTVKATMNKSWTTSRAVAELFANGEYTNDSPVSGRKSLVLRARMPTDAVLNYRLIAEIPAVGQEQHPRWGTVLEETILFEAEVLLPKAPKRVAIVDETALDDSVIW